MIKVENISKFYTKSNFDKNKKFVLESVSFCLERGKTTGFIGSNGAGKTTIFKILLGLIKSNQGNIIFDNNLGTTTKQIFNSIGFLPEKTYIYPDLTAIEFLKYSLSLSGKKYTDQKILIENLLNKFDLHHVGHKKIKDFSKGMTQKLYFISTIAHEPKIIILDEPMSGLDPIGRKLIKEAINELRKKNVTTFFSSHVLDDVIEICDNLVILKDKKIFYEGTINNFFIKNNKEDKTIKFKLNHENFDLFQKSYSNVLIIKDNYQNNTFYMDCFQSELNKLINQILLFHGEILEVKNKTYFFEDIIYNNEKHN